MQFPPESASRPDDAPDDAVAVIAGGRHALLPESTPRAALDDMAGQLAALRSRVLRPATDGALTLPGLLAQMAERDDAALAAADLERGFERLTQPGPGCDRVVLVLDRADALHPAALRYLQLAARDAPLRLLLAAGPGLRGLLQRDEFGSLRRDCVDCPAATAADAARPAAASFPAADAGLAEAVGAAAAKHPARRRWFGGFVLAGAGIAASAVGVAWLLHSGVPIPGLSDAGRLLSGLGLAPR